MGFQTHKIQIIFAAFFIFLFCIGIQIIFECSFPCKTKIWAPILMFGNISWHSFIKCCKCLPILRDEDSLNFARQNCPACNHCKSEFGNYTLKTEMWWWNLMVDHSTQMFGSVKSSPKTNWFFSWNSQQQYSIATIQKRLTYKFLAWAQL